MLSATKCAAAAVGLCLIAGPAVHAQDADPAPPSVNLYSDADAAAVLNARLIALKTVLELTPEQEKLWTPFEASIRATEAAAAARSKLRQQGVPPSDFLDVLERIADSEATRAAELKSLVSTGRPLVASLSDVQKRRVPAFLGMKDSKTSLQSSAELWIFEEEQN
jgi:hypothetical protein